MAESGMKTLQNRNPGMCPLCRELYKKPKFLPCLHTFCESCLKAYIVNVAEVCQTLENLPASIFDNKPFVWTGDGIPCPVCRTHVPAPSKVRHSPPEEWARGFPINQLILSIMGGEKIEQETLCGPCEKIAEPRSAKYGCVDCLEAMCKDCARHHMVLSATRSHRVHPIDEIKDRKRTKNEEITICQEHDGKSIEHYCVDHNVVLCAECVALHHTNCASVIDIYKVAMEIRDSLEANKLLDRIKECLVESENVVADRRLNIEKLHNRKAEILGRIRGIKEEVLSCLSQLESIFSDEFETLHKMEVSKVDDTVNRCQLLQKAIISSEGILQAAITHGTDNELFVTAHRMEREVQKYESLLEREISEIKDIDYSFAVNYEIEHVLLSLDEIGTVIATKGTSQLNSSAKKNCQQLSKFDATSAMDSRCAELTGGGFLENDHVLLVDNANEKLKLFTTDGDLLSELELSSAPWDVTIINASTAATTLPDEKTVLLVNINNECITPIEQFKTSCKCYGIAYSYSEKTLAVTCDTAYNEKASIKILTVGGKELKELVTDNTGQVLFNSPSYVASNPFTNDIYVTDETNNTVTGLTLDGSLRFRYTENYLKLPTGVAADSHGCVYICGNGSCDVHQLSREGKRIKILLDGVVHPRAISFEPYGDKFLVTSDGSFKSTVLIYKLK
ncbi:hypothetical protein ACJMK2_016710 [Sinanodonta woodiana]|uniref:Uncharacterized protein n=1 Tax=Sinanodonta woodiana TaxID=1069815 RepID=A0ABD3UVK5_SINWO